MDINIYEGKFGCEQRIGEVRDPFVLPRKNDLVFLNEEAYKVIYTMIDYTHSTYEVFTKKFNYEE